MELFELPAYYTIAPPLSSIALSEPGSRDIQYFPIFRHRSASNCTHASFGELFAKRIVAEGLGFVLVIDDLLKLCFNRIPAMLGTGFIFHTSAKETAKWKNPLRTLHVFPRNSP